MISVWAAQDEASISLMQHSTLLATDATDDAQASNGGSTKCSTLIDNIGSLIDLTTTCMATASPSSLGMKKSLGKMVGVGKPRTLGTRILYGRKGFGHVHISVLQGAVKPGR